MKKCLVIAACLAFVLLSGCNRCGMWDWYDPCDLVEGRAERMCRPCGPVYRPCNMPPRVVCTEMAVPADATMDPLPAPEAPEPVIIEEVVEEAPE